MIEIWAAGLAMGAALSALTYEARARRVECPRLFVQCVIAGVVVGFAGVVFEVVR